MADRHKEAPLSVRLPTALLEWVRAQACAGERSMSAVVIEAVREKRDREAI